MKRAAIIAAWALAMAAATARAQDTAPLAAPEPYQVLRATDRAMSCEDLAKESNELNAWLIADHQATVQKASQAKATGNFLRSAGKFGLSRFGGGLGAMGAKVALAANDAAANAVVASGLPTDASVPQQQRMAHLLELYKEKAC